MVKFAPPGWKTFFLLAALFFSLQLRAQSNVNVRIMAANLNGNTQSYQPFALRILQGLKPDVVCIQEFNYASTNGVDVNDAAAFREMINLTLGTNYVYYREPFTANGAIPNGIISRWPILASGSWADAQQSQPNRGFAWAQIQLPGTNSLYVVSVHLLTTSATARSAEATALQGLIQSNFPTNAWIILAGDFNTDSRTESTTMTTCDSYLSDFPIPVDNNGNSFTSENRNYPHDYVLPSFALTNFETATVLPSHTFPGGLVFDSTVYTPLSDVAPVQFGDSTNAQHMAVLKDFSILVGTNSVTNAPAITTQPQSQSVATGSSASFSVIATSTSPLNYQWFFNGTNIFGATNNLFSLASAQLTNAGNYFVIVTNIAGSVTSSVAVLNVSNAPPVIAVQPQNQNVLAGQTATFNVTVSGTLPLNFQWLFGGTNISGATTNPFVLTNVQSANTGNYSVVITNLAGSVTSSVATLAILFTNPVVFAQWNFNSAPPDASSSTGSTAPSVGDGTASLTGGVTATFATGDTNLDTATTDNTGWNLTGYPAGTVSNKTAGAQFAVSTAGKQNIVIYWSLRSSNTGGKYFRLQYSTDGGASFTDYPAAVTLPLATIFYPFTNDLSALPGVNNNSNFVFRIAGEFQSTATGSGGAAYAAANTGSTYAASGTSRFDMVTVSGTAILAVMPAVLNLPAVSGNQIGFTVSGSAGVNYVVQTSTNLGAPNWVSMFTNTPPFSFSDTNVSGQQKFYRAVSQ
jgi:endonuclease/exonuclease/phosphatase family metal-dependent hydrolase